MTMAAPVEAGTRDVWTHPEQERVGTSATLVTGVRTVASVVLAGLAAQSGSLPLLVAALVVYWAGDRLDGQHRPQAPFRLDLTEKASLFIVKVSRERGALTGR